MEFIEGKNERKAYILVKFCTGNQKPMRKYVHEYLRSLSRARESDYKRTETLCAALVEITN